MWKLGHLLIIVLLVVLGEFQFSLAVASDIFPLWEKDQTVQNYAQLLGIPANKTINLSKTQIELVLIPAGHFQRGTPIPPDFHLSATPKYVFCASLIFTVILLIRYARNYIKFFRRSFALNWLLSIVVSLGGCLYGQIEGQRQSEALKKHEQALERLKLADDSEKCAVGETVLTRPFYFGKYLVTQEQFSEVMGVDNSIYKFGTNPVDNTSWEDAQEFCSKLSKLSGLKVSLPSEVQWEFACRAGTQTNYYAGDLVGDLDRAGWYIKNSKQITHPVGRKEPNFFGLFDMHGNVWEWCADVYNDTYPVNSSLENNTGPKSDGNRVIRGGSEGALANDCRSAKRLGMGSRNKVPGIGFRILVSLP